MQDHTFMKLPNVSRETSEKIDHFQMMYKKWGSQINLSSGRDMQNLFHRHLLDSAQLSLLISKKEVCLDVGSGGGFPGVVLSILGHKMSLCETNPKKISFLEEARRILSLDFEIIPTSAYDIRGTYSFVTSRAFSSLTNLLEILRNVSRETTWGVFPKGKKYLFELEEAQKKWIFESKLIDSVTDKMSKIVVVYNLSLK
jgi:16S rRNA (guanine527-N7)-methyltransferase